MMNRRSLLEFPTHIGQEFQEFLRATAMSDRSTPSPAQVVKVFGTHSPASAAPSELYDRDFGVTALRLINETELRASRALPHFAFRPGWNISTS